MRPGHRLAVEGNSGGAGMLTATRPGGWFLPGRHRSGDGPALFPQGLP